MIYYLFALNVNKLFESFFLQVKLFFVTRLYKLYINKVETYINKCINLT